MKSRKTEHPILFSTEMVHAILDGRKTQTRKIVKPQHPKEFHCVKCPYGKVGDLLWVREAWNYGNLVKPVIEDDFIYRSERNEHAGPKWSGRWRPSIHMPKEAARIWLKVTKVRLDLLHGINENDAIAEGVDNVGLKLGGYQQLWRDYTNEVGCWTNPIVSFMSLWLSINGKGSWDANPWVWVVEFEVISTNGKP